MSDSINDHLDVIEHGTYVLAVSGGVDSMVLAQLLVDQPGLGLVIAHYDHGIRDDSAADRHLVKAWASEHNLTFEYEEGALGAEASEAFARGKRYVFLKKIKDKHKASAIITAHHQDDVIETQILQLMRGSGRSALSALQSTSEIVRPLLGISKNHILNYAMEHDIAWQEDSTNSDTVYLRNYIRAFVLPQFTPEARSAFIDMHAKMTLHNAEIDDLLSQEVASTTVELPSGYSFKRTHFVGYEKRVALEYLRTLLLKIRPEVELSRKRLEALWLFCKTAETHKEYAFSGLEFSVQKGLVTVKTVGS